MYLPQSLEIYQIRLSSTKLGSGTGTKNKKKTFVFPQNHNLPNPNIRKTTFFPIILDLFKVFKEQL